MGCSTAFPKPHPSVRPVGQKASILTPDTRPTLIPSMSGLGERHQVLLYVKNLLGSDIPERPSDGPPASLEWNPGDGSSPNAHPLANVRLTGQHCEGSGRATRCIVGFARGAAHCSRDGAERAFPGTANVGAD